MYLVRVKITQTNEASKAHMRSLPYAKMEGFENGDALYKFENEFDAREYAAQARSPENHVHSQLTSRSEVEWAKEYRTKYNRYGEYIG